MMKLLITFSVLVLSGCTGGNTEEIYFPDGAIKEIRNYQNGLRHGISVLFLENGDTSRVFVHKEDSLKSMRVLINNQTFIYQEFKDSTIKHGKEVFHHPNGQIETTAEFRNGLPHGATLGYYEDGTPRTVMRYENGKGIGKFAQYYPNGNPFVLSADVTTNIYTLHDSTGTKLYDLLMKNGKSTDTLKIY